MNFKKPKIVIDPLLGLIDVTDIIPLMDILPFQSLGYKNQLGLTSSIFPAATHTRKQHSLGAYARTKKLAGEWVDHGFINEDQAKNLPIFALYHDLGHGPFSHVTEPLGSVDHDTRGLKIFESLKNVVEDAGFDYDMIHSIFSRKDPLYQAVFDKNLGMEKLDYLERDAFYTIGERPGVGFLAHHVYLVEDKIMINEIAVDQAKDIQNFYIKMYKHVYLRKKPSILQRLVEKMTYYLVEDGLTEDDLFNMTDAGLLGQFEVSKNKRIIDLYEGFKKGTFPKLALEFKYDKVASSDSLSKSVKEVGMPEVGFNQIVSMEEWKKFDFVEKMERDIEEIIGIPEGNIVIIQPQAKHRIEPNDINVYLQNGSITSIAKMYPGHFEAMREYGRSHLSIRISVFEKFREKLYKNEDKVKEYLLQLK